MLIFRFYAYIKFSVGNCIKNIKIFIHYSSDQCCSVYICIIYIHCVFYTVELNLYRYLTIDMMKLRKISRMMAIYFWSKYSMKYMYTFLLAHIFTGIVAIQLNISIFVIT